MTAPPRPRLKRDQRIFDQLEQWRSLYHHPKYLDGDPLRFAHRYRSPADQEVVALISAAFASGYIRFINVTLEAIFAVMGKHPAAWLRKQKPADLAGRFEGIGHRWVRSLDIEILMALLGDALRRHGSLGALWEECDDGDAPTIFPPLERFVNQILAGDRGGVASRAREAVRADGTITPLAPVETILLTSPGKGSACKRMALFLRWMIRPEDGIDLGLWSHHTSASRLVVPLDVHVMRITRELKLARRSSPSRKSAEEVTRAYRRLCPEDPCRWDFCLVRAGIDS
ncbi:MAG: TIGR02757 family protein [Candidatus Sumerlaeia bacterium]|nr:TIGR02757 family protein [Candidatus Sumerlaeia bacterium]